MTWALNGTMHFATCEIELSQPHFAGRYYECITSMHCQYRALFRATCLLLDYKQKRE